MYNKLILFSVVIMAIVNTSFRWPVTDGIVTSSFGESRGDHFHDGVDVISGNENVYPVEHGTLLFAWNKSYFPLENYWGGGNYKVLKHQDGLLSIYMHLQDTDSFKQAYGDNDVIGYIGDTGHSYGRHLHFSVLNQDKKESINPFKFMPSNEDSKAPDILNFYFHIDNKYIRINNNADIRLTKHYPLLVEIRDTIKGNENLGIYRLKAVFNGKEILNTEFSGIGLGSNGLIVNHKAYDELFDKKGYYKINGLEYNSGINTLIVTAADFNGNTSEKIFTINVKLDMQ